jgi:hypothetical protein
MLADSVSMGMRCRGPARRESGDWHRAARSCATELGRPEDNHADEFARRPHPSDARRVQYEHAPIRGQSSLAPLAPIAVCTDVTQGYFKETDAETHLLVERTISFDEDKVCGARTLEPSRRGAVSAPRACSARYAQVAYTGLPAHLQALNVQFGIPISRATCRHVESYEVGRCLGSQQYPECPEIRFGPHSVKGREVSHLLCDARCLLSCITLTVEMSTVRVLEQAPIPAILELFRQRLLAETLQSTADSRRGFEYPLSITEYPEYHTVTLSTTEPLSPLSA